MTEFEAYKNIVGGAFSISLNCKDFFAYACAWGLEVYPKDIEWMAKFIASKPDKDYYDASNACMAYIANREPIKPWVKENFTKYIEELKASNQEVFSDLDDHHNPEGPYRKLKVT